MRDEKETEREGVRERGERERESERERERDCLVAQWRSNVLNDLLLKLKPRAC